jgi:hypothetical protein
MKIAGDASTRPDGDGDNWTIPPRLDRWCAQMPADAHFYYIGRSPAHPAIVTTEAPPPGHACDRPHLATGHEHGEPHSDRE